MGWFLKESESGDVKTEVKGSSIFGMISVIVGLCYLFAPRLFSSIFEVVIIVFAVIGFFKDKSKIWALIGLCFPLLVFANSFVAGFKGASLYLVRYEVECEKCTIHIENKSGGTDIHESTGRYVENVELLGSQNLSLYASSDYRSSGSIKASIYSNDVLLKTESSSGSGAHVLIQGKPLDVE